MPNETDSDIKTLSVVQAKRIHGPLINIICYTAFFGWGYIMYQSDMMFGLIPAFMGVLLTFLASQYEDFGVRYYNNYQILKAMMKESMELSIEDAVKKGPDNEKETD